MRTSHELQNFMIAATDGLIGHIRDLYFDDRTWTIRYLVVHTGAWLAGKDVLISPQSLGRPDFNGHVIPATLTQSQVRGSPDIEVHKPVSRQHEMRYYDYFGYPYYWGGVGLWGAGYYPGAAVGGAGDGRTDAEYLAADVDRVRTKDQHGSAVEEDPRLRSCHAVIGYGIEATDGELGAVKDLLFDEYSWAIRYLIADTSSWWFGHEVLIAPQWIDRVSWAERGVRVSLTRKSVRDSPAYDSTQAVNRRAEAGLYAHYGRLGYWRAASTRATPP